MRTVFIGPPLVPKEEFLRKTDIIWILCVTVHLFADAIPSDLNIILPSSI